MKHIELLTMESYLEAKKDVIANGGYTLKELHVEYGERITEILQEIWKEYFGENGDEQEKCIFVSYVGKDNEYELGVSDSIYISPYMFLEDWKDKCSSLMEEGQDKKIVEDIQSTISKVFVYSCTLPDGYMKKIYEIIKYGFSDGKECKYLNENGKFINELDEDDDIFPFKIKDGRLPIYCQKMQRVLFGEHRRIFINFNNYKKSDIITKFSFYNVDKIVKEVIEALVEKEKKTNNASYIEGMEDFSLLDEILGISLTNIIYMKTKAVTTREVQDRIIKVVARLAECHFVTGRNLVAQVLLDYLEAIDYNTDIVYEVEKSLKRKIKEWNEWYEEVEAVHLCTIFKYLLECPRSDLVEVCKDIKGGNWSEYMYMEEIAKNENMIKVDGEGKYKIEKRIQIPKGTMNNRTWYAYIHKTVFEAIWR